MSIRDRDAIDQDHEGQSSGLTENIQYDFPIEIFVIDGDIDLFQTCRQFCDSLNKPTEPVGRGAERHLPTVAEVA
ncbi:MAG: hypothetical protein O2856_10580, partial [Planctomycetota bacterium]|nr:hypothetical protein [Planctomycetota bacterium]